MDGIRVLGKPGEFAKHYYEQGADELIYMDVVASLYGRNSLLDVVSESAKHIFIPLTVGGGIRSIEDIRKALQAGADKVSINTAALRNPDFITEAANHYGSSTIVVSIEAMKKDDGSWEAYTDNGREPMGKNVLDWALEAEIKGAGEILITAIDRDGTGNGFDYDLVRQINKKLKIPVLISGGGGKKENVSEVLEDNSLSGIVLSSLLHYNYLKVKQLQNNQKETLFSRYSNAKNANVENCSLIELKKFLSDQGISVRLLNEME